MPELAKRPVAAKRSAIREIFDLADKDPTIVRLEVGEPSFTTPGHIIDAALAAAEAGFTRYTPNGGLLSLRELICEKLAHVDKYEATPEQVVVTPGAMNAIYSTFLVLLEPGDEVILPTPGFPNMDETVRLLGANPVFYRLQPTSEFLPDVDEIESLISSNTKAVFINTPANPTGAVFPQETMQRLVDLSNRHNIWLISDEVYDELILDDDLSHVAARSLDGGDQVITFYSFSKVYAMTGWRLGYAVAPEPVADLMRKMQEPLCSCPSTISQKAAEAALTGPRGPIDEMRRIYAERRNRGWELATEEGIATVRTRGTFYMLLDVGAGEDTMDYAQRLLRTARVSVAPGCVFGPGGTNLVRISLAADLEQVEQGIQRIAAFSRAATAAI